MTSGAPFETTSTPLPGPCTEVPVASGSVPVACGSGASDAHGDSCGTACQVVIRFVRLSKGTSASRRCAARNPTVSTPAAPAVSRSADSVGSWRSPPSTPSPTSLHSTTARMRDSGEAPSGCQVDETAINPSVRVPVLSVASSVTEPSVSTAARLRTTACREAMRRAARAMLRVTTSGSDSGTAATMRLTPVRSIRSTGSPRNSPSAKTREHSTTAATARWPESRLIRSCNGVRRCCVPTIRAAMRPVALAEPVAVTRAVPRPRTTAVPA